MVMTQSCPRRRTSAIRNSSFRTYRVWSCSSHRCTMLVSSASKCHRKWLARPEKRFMTHRAARMWQRQQESLPERYGRESAPSADLVAGQLHAGEVVALDPHLDALRHARRREAVHRRRQQPQAEPLLRHLQARRCTVSTP